MYKEVLRSIHNIEIYPVISFIIFGLFFLGMLYLVIRMDKKHVHNMSDLPMNDATTPDNYKNQSHE